MCVFLAFSRECGATIKHFRKVLGKHFIIQSIKMCCGCSSLYTFIGGCMYVFERLASCCAVASVVTCIITTLLIMLGLGIGLGYSYCVVDNKFPSEDSATPLPPDPADVPRAQRKSWKETTTTTTTTTTTRPTTLPPLTTNFDFSQIDPIIFMTEKPLTTTTEATPIEATPIEGTPIEGTTTKATKAEITTPNDRLKKRDFTLQYQTNKEIARTHVWSKATTEVVLVVSLRKVGLMALIENLIERNKNVTLKLVAAQ